VTSSISLEASLRFGELSGDVNPLHVDPTAARRLRFGGTVVHGVHLLLTAIDAYLADGSAPGRLTSLRAKFRAPVATGTVCTTETIHRPDAGSAITVRDGDRIVQEVTLGAFSADDRPDRPLPAGRSYLAAPRAIDLNQVGGGKVELALDSRLLGEMFPHAAQRLPIRQLASIIATTYVVGMECPGLHSIFAELSLDFMPEDPDAADELRYSVAKADARMQRLVLDLAGPSVTGNLTAFFRNAAVQQPTVSDIRQRVPSAIFEGQRALVIGGSRGLGEALAKVVAAGGGEVAITFKSGAADARRVADEISGAGGTAHTVQYDVQRETAEFASALPAGWSPTHVYFFATPHIALSRGGWEPELFEHFCSYYVHGFARMLGSVEKQFPGGSRPRRYLYPSSVYVTEAPAELSEYAAAKAAGEVLARRLALKTKGAIATIVERLPRLFTDQTGADDRSVFPSTIEVMLAFALLGIRDDDAGRTRSENEVHAPSA